MLRLVYEHSSQHSPKSQPWKGRARIAIAISLVTLGIHRTASAQSESYFDRNNNVGVRDRPRPDYQALGLEEGAFVIFPSLTISPEYDDNIFASHDDRQDDLITAISPALRIDSNWSRNALSAHASATSDVYASHSGENTTDYDFGTAGRYDIAREDNLTGNFDYAHSTIPRSSENSLGSASTPVQYDSISANAGAIQTLNRLRFSEHFSFLQTTYDDSVTAPQANAPINIAQYNSDNETAGGRINYALNPEISIYTSGSYNNRSYANQPPIVPLDRNSTGFEITTGTSFDVTRLVRGEIEVGYLQQNYQSTLFKPVNGPTVHASLEYFLSGLTTVGINGNRSVIDAIDPTAVSFIQTNGGISIDHELLRNVILSSNFKYETDAFTGIQRTDTRTSVALSATYLINRHLGLTGSYSFLNESSSGEDRRSSFLANVIALSLVIQL